MLEFSSHCAPTCRPPPPSMRQDKNSSRWGVWAFYLFGFLMFFYRSDWKHIGVIQKGIVFLWKKITCAQMISELLKRLGNMG